MITLLFGCNITGILEVPDIHTRLNTDTGSRVVMASVRFEMLRRISRSLLGFYVPRVRSKVSNRGSILLGSLLGLGATGFVASTAWNRRKSDTRTSVLLSCVEASSGMEVETQKKPVGRSYRETRFRHFASCEFNGELFMTPRDFLESLANDQPAGMVERHAREGEYLSLRLCCCSSHWSEEAGRNGNHD